MNDDKIIQRLEMNIAFLDAATQEHKPEPISMVFGSMAILMDSNIHIIRKLAQKG